MKILFVGLDTMPYIGGIETFVLKEVSYLDKNKYEVHILSFHGDTPCFYEEFLKLGAEFHFIPNRRDHFISNYYELIKLLKTYQFDIIHCNLNSYSYITPCLLALKTGSKVIIHGHNSGCLQGNKSILLHNINKRRIPFDKVYNIAVSDVAGKWFFGKHDYVILNNGVETEKNKYSVEKRRKIRKEFGLDEEKVILHVGAFRNQKNHERIISIFTDVLKEKSNSVLFLVGEGNLKNSLQQKVRDVGLASKVIFTGNRDDVDCFLSAADVFLFPSFYEGFPIALIEAECSGLQCVISDVITKQVQIEGICKTVSLDEENDEWVEKIVSALECKEDRKKYAEIIENLGLGMDSEIKQIERIYDTLMEE